MRTMKVLFTYNQYLLHKTFTKEQLNNADKDGFIGYNEKYGNGVRCYLWRYLEDINERYSNAKND